MSNQPQPKPDAKPVGDDQLVISSISFVAAVNLAGHANVAWPLSGVGRNRYHGRSRAQWIPAGVRIHFKAGDVYEQITVPWSNLSQVTEIPLSRLTPPTREMYEKCQKEIRR